MASRTRIPKAELTGSYGAMVKRMPGKMLGDLPEPVEVAWHNRKVLPPGLLAATRTEHPPAGDDELTNSKIRCYVTASPPAPLGARKIEANP